MDALEQAQRIIDAATPRERRRIRVEDALVRITWGCAGLIWGYLIISATWPIFG